MRRLKKIEIRNFKFFQNTFCLDLEGRRLLMYGENGAGKSSIFWSLYTHFQAVTKNKSQAQKYFLATETENLRNRYCEESEDSYIELTFGKDGVADYVIRDAATWYYPDDTAYHDFMELSMISSDFLNYKSLADLFNFKNSEKNEIFPMVLKDFGPFIDLTEEFSSRLVDFKDSKNSQTWWRYLQMLKDTLPKNTKKKFDTKSEEYQDYQKLIGSYNKMMSKALGTITLRANEILSQLGATDVQLKVVYEKATFNELVKPRKRDSELHPPRICVHAEMIGPKVKIQEEITHPKSFFNEAKLTCMALAFRLAILSQRPPIAGAASIIAVDDLLISLDMTLRRMVIKLLMKDFANRQVLVFTHDRSFFHMMEQEIKRLNPKEWKMMKLYADVNADGVPSPHLVQSKAYIEEARMLLAEFRLAACANTLRRGYEYELKRLLPNNLHYQVNYDNPERAQIDLNGLVTAFNNLVRDKKMPDIVPSLHTDRQLILNPFSHDDMEAPLYRHELLSLIEDLDKLSRVKRKALIEADEIGKSIYKIEISNKGYMASAEIRFLEMAYEYSYDGQKYYLNPKVKTIVCNPKDSLKAKLFGKNLGINQVYSHLANAVSLNSTTAPNVWSLMTAANH